MSKTELEIKTNITAIDIFISSNDFIEINDTGNLLVKKSVFQDCYSLGYINSKKEDLEWSIYVIGFQRDEKLYIIDYVFPQQQNTSTNSTITDKGLEQYQISTFEKQIAFEKKYDNHRLFVLGQWHSHNTMSAFFSGTDDTHIKEFIDTVKESKMPQVFLVFSFKDSKFTEYKEFEDIKTENRIEYKIAIYSKLEYSNEYTGLKYDFNFTYECKPNNAEKHNELFTLVEDRQTKYVYVAPKVDKSNINVYNYGYNKKYWKDYRTGFKQYYENSKNEPDPVEISLQKQFIDSRIDPTFDWVLPKDSYLRNDKFISVSTHNFRQKDSVENICQKFVSLLFRDISTYNITDLIKEFKYYLGDMVNKKTYTFLTEFFNAFPNNQFKLGEINNTFETAIEKYHETTDYNYSNLYCESQVCLVADCECENECQKDCECSCESLGYCYFTDFSYLGVK